MEKLIEKLEAQLEKQDERIECIRQELSEINSTLVRNTSSLEYHVKRTDMLEDKLNSVPQKVLVFLSILGAFISIGSRLL